MKDNIMMYVVIESNLYLINNKDYNNLMGCNSNCHGSFNYFTAYELNEVIQYIKENYARIENFDSEYFSITDLDHKNQKIVETKLPF